MEFEYADRDKHPQYWEEGGFLESQAQISADGIAKVYLIKDPEQHVLVDNAASFSSEILDVNFIRCRNQTSSVTCASPDEISSYLALHRLGLVTVYNYIDYDEVDPYSGPLKSVYQWLELRELKFEEQKFGT